METLVINQQKTVDYSPELQQVILNVADAGAKIGNISKKTQLSVLIVDNAYINELNLIYRGVNEPTDVLSFSMNELGEDEPDFDFPGDISILSDIVISLEQAKKQSIEYRHSLEREVGYLIAHGILHLIGYDHETEDEKAVMRDFEERIMKDVGLVR
jgi:probable rRNA maturation factor